MGGNADKKDVRAEEVARQGFGQEEKVPGQHLPELCRVSRGRRACGISIVSGSRQTRGSTALE